jgi:beta-galactosidase
LLDNFMTEVNNAFTQEATNIITHQREIVLCDMIARSLALTHRPFDAVELTRSTLDAAQTPTCWVMMEKQCPPEVQQKLVDYVHGGGRLILIGRLCIEGFDHAPCTILKDALVIQEIKSDAPFVTAEIDVFNYKHVPASFVECYNGRFDEIVTTRSDEIVGFVKAIGKGKVLMFGAAVPAYNFEDLDIIHQMAVKMDCPPLFKLSEWADVRLATTSRSRTGTASSTSTTPITPASGPWPPSGGGRVTRRSS